MTNGLEPAYSPFPFSGAFMRTFGPIVRVRSRVMERVGHQVAMGRAIALEFVGHELPGRLALLLEQPTKESGCGLSILPRLEQDIEDLAVLIDGSV